MQTHRRCFTGTGKTKGRCTAEAKEQIFPERSGIEWSELPVKRSREKMADKGLLDLATWKVIVTFCDE